jgi:TIR domain
MSRVAESLLQLRNQIDAMAPERDRSSDATIGDPSFSARKSDHNPNSDGVVTAIDITHDPAHGIDAREIAELLRLSKDLRIKYVICNGRIFSSRTQPLQWRPYAGANAHANHLHLSVVGDKALYDDPRPWAIEGMAKVIQPTSVIEPSQVIEPPQVTEPPRPPQERAPKRYTNIIATVLGGPGEDESSAYDGQRIDEAEVGVALPFRFKGARPEVKVTNPANGQSVVCKIVDVGPWEIDDPYWESGSRPRAESGRDKRGRMTNRAGIELTPAAARAIGLPGKGRVEWEFVEQPEGAPVLVDVLMQRIQRLENLTIAEKTGRDGSQFPSPGEIVRPTIPNDTRPWRTPAVEGRTALNEELSLTQMGNLSVAFRATPPGRGGVIVLDGRAPDDSRMSTAGAPPPGAVPGPAPARPDDVTAWLERLVTVVERVKGTTTIPPSAPPQPEQLRKALELLTTILAPGTDARPPPLGPVNGALGETLGNLLNGKKTAIGVVGAALTSILSQAPATSGLGQALALLPTAGLSPFAMPIFLAMSAWGVLGKFEKWSQDIAVADGPPLSARSDTLQRNINLLLQLASIAGGARNRDVSGGGMSVDARFAEPIEDLVDCSVFGPPAAPPGETIRIQVFLHLPDQAERARHQANFMDPSAVKGAQALQTFIRRRATVEFSVSVNTLLVEEPIQSTRWWGEPTFCQFRMTIPLGTDGQTFQVNVRMSVDGQLVGRIMFHISSDRSAGSPRSRALGDHARRYEYAFLSYADEDLGEVTASARLLNIVNIEYFLAKHSLRSGARWEQELYNHINRCDLFLLFWSQYAKNSQWVRREADYALGRQRRDPNEEPDIVPLELEENVDLPPNLAHLHFNHPLNDTIFRRRRPPPR